MSAFDVFDSVLCINLDHRTDRWAEAQAELALCGLAARCRRWPGIHVLPSESPARNGGMGCTTSHRNIWRAMTRGELGERVLIFEDDFKLLLIEDILRAGHHAHGPIGRMYGENFPARGDDTAAWLSDRLDRLMAHVPKDWDVLYLGGGYQTHNNQAVNAHCIRTGGMLGTHSYAITRTHAEKLTAFLDPRYDPADIGQFPGQIDGTLSRFAPEQEWGIPGANYYTTCPRLFIQRPSYSDIWTRHDSYFNSHTDPNHELACWGGDLARRWRM